MRTAFGWALLVLAGCQGVSTVTPLDGQTNAPGKAQSGSMVLQLDAPAEAPAGGPVQLALTLTNTSKQPVDVYLGGRPPYDFIVTTSGGAEVWQWSEGRAVQAILEVRKLNPGEQVQYHETWPVKDNDGTPASPGRYLVRGVLHLDPPENLETTPKGLVLTSR